MPIKSELDNYFRWKFEIQARIETLDGERSLLQKQLDDINNTISQEETNLAEDLIGTKQRLKRKK